MENNINVSEVFNDFEIKLKQSVETIKTQNNRINELNVRLKEEVDERQRVHQLYETQHQKCRQLTDLLTKLETDSKIAMEKESIEFKEQKALDLSQIQRMAEQINHLKHQMNAIQTKSSYLQQKLLRDETDLQKQNAYRLTIESELSQIDNNWQPLAEEFNRLAENQIQLKDIVEASDRLNLELRAQLNQRNQQIIDINKEKTDLKAVVSHLKEKCCQTERALNDSELQSLRFSQQNDLQKQEIHELKALLEESFGDKQLLKKQFYEKDINRNQSTECGLNEEPVSGLLSSTCVPLICLSPSRDSGTGVSAIYGLDSTDS